MSLSTSLSRRSRLSLEALEARELLSGNPITPPSDLADPLVKHVAGAEFAQHQGKLTRSDVKHLLGVVDGTQKATFSNGQVSFTHLTNTPTGTVSGAQLTDLQTLDKDAAGWHLSDAVTNLLGKVVNYTPANKHYQGQSLLASGQLSAGAADSTMVDLVDKWFLGTDVPSLTGFQGATYERAKGSLFGTGGPHRRDIGQGQAADCYFMSALGELAQQSSGAIKNLFISNGDGTFTVRFYKWDASTKSPVADYVTVNRMLPVDSNGAFYFANQEQYGKPTNYKNASNILWPALAEKAYAQVAEEGWSRNPTGSFSSGFQGSGMPGNWNQNAYSALNYGVGGFALEQITGSTQEGYASFTSSTENTLASDFSKGYSILILTPGTEPSGSPIISGHFYMLEAVNTKTDTFVLINPYHDKAGYSWEGERVVKLTWAQLEQYGYDFQFIPPPATA
jgi:hypothetical protein